MVGLATCSFLPRIIRRANLQRRKLIAFTESLFRAIGVPTDEAARVAQSLVLANLCGHDSHGMIRVMQYADAIKDGRLKPGAPFNIVKQTAR